MLKNIVRIYFESFNFNRISDKAIMGGNLNIRHDMNIDFKEDKHMHVKVFFDVVDENKTFSLNISMVGIFEIEIAVQNKEEVKTLIQNNILAIMYPYIRSHVSLMTTMPDFPPITLPLLTFDVPAEIKEKIEKNKSE
ncbi:MAG: protein-export chaperone SecB [Firmicutes bacterium]|nr:protein-export chaperone SecB [Bacillota bacterium]